MTNVAFRLSIDRGFNYLLITGVLQRFGHDVLIVTSSIREQQIDRENPWPIVWSFKLSLGQISTLTQLIIKCPRTWLMDFCEGSYTEYGKSALAPWLSTP